MSTEGRTRRQVADPAFVVIGVLVMLVAWTAVSALAYQRSGLIPSPLAVAERLTDNLTGTVTWNAIFVTAGEAGAGYAIGNALALALAFAILLAPRIEGIGLQFAVTSSCVPITALAPLIVLMSGPGSRVAAIALAALGVFYTTAIGALVGLRPADRSAVELVRAYGGGTWMTIRKVRFLSAVPSVLAALRIAAPAALVGALLGEFFLSGVDSGLGIMIKAAQIQLDPRSLWALAILCAILAGVTNLVLTVLFRRLAPWGTSRRAGTR